MVRKQTKHLTMYKKQEARNKKSRFTPVQNQNVCKVTDPTWSKECSRLSAHALFVCLYIRINLLQIQPATIDCLITTQYFPSLPELSTGLVALFLNIFTTVQFSSVLSNTVQFSSVLCNTIRYIFTVQWQTCRC